MRTSLIVERDLCSACSSLMQSIYFFLPEQCSYSLLTWQMFTMESFSLPMNSAGIVERQAASTTFRLSKEKSAFLRRWSSTKGMNILARMEGMRSLFQASSTTRSLREEQGESSTNAFISPKSDWVCSRAATAPIDLPHTAISMQPRSQSSFSTFFMSWDYQYPTETNSPSDLPEPLKSNTQSEQPRSSSRERYSSPYIWEPLFE